MQKCFFAIQIYFGFEDTFIYSNSPVWNQAYKNILPYNYFRVFLEDPLELKTLSPQEWQWHKDSQEPWEDTCEG